MMQTTSLDFVEKKGCITFSKVCVNLGKVANLETGEEQYYCTHDFPEDCSKYGCPHYMLISNPNQWKLRKLSKKELQMLREFNERAKEK
jgi:hypothetical protein